MAMTMKWRCTVGVFFALSLFAAGGAVGQQAYRPLVAVSEWCSTNEFAAIGTAVLDGIAAAGANPVLLPETDDDVAVQTLLASVDMVLIPDNGPASPRRADWERRLRGLAADLHVPDCTAAGIAACRAASGRVSRAPRRYGLVAVPDYCLTNGMSVMKANMVSALVKAGFFPYVVPFTADNAALAGSLRPADALLVSGGFGLQDYDRRFDLEIRAVRIALGRAIPIAGVCHGAQVINVAFGGTLTRTPQSSGAANPQVLHRRVNVVPWTDTYHAAETVAGSRIASVLGTGTVVVNSSHSRCIDRLGTGIRVTARAPDGVVEAIEHETLPVMGFQFHPERMTFDARMVKLLRTALGPRDP